MNADTGKLECSVYRAQSATSLELWDICATHVDNPATGQVMAARGTCTAQVILDEGLSFDADGRPHARHANVISWPVTKDEQKIAQQKIVAAMTLELRPARS